MKKEMFQIQIISPCFAGGAIPEEIAEIRAPAIRGHLRWWFRTLGGFKILKYKSLTEQEGFIFGKTRETSQAGLLLIRTSCVKSTELKNSKDFGATPSSPLGYALFPLRQTKESQNKRAIIPTETEFELTLLWKGPDELYPSIRALVAVWAHLGGLGFRSRRGFGALRLVYPKIPLRDALTQFTMPENITIKELKLDKDLPYDKKEPWKPILEKLLKWYQSWRTHGQMNRRWDKNQKRWIPIPESRKQENLKMPGFSYARRDHNEGLAALGILVKNNPKEPKGKPNQSFRPALGLPIIQYFSSLEDLKKPQCPRNRKEATVKWDWDWDPNEEKPIGRFASPVLLRPYLDEQNQWHSLVIFIDYHKWPENHKVVLSKNNQKLKYLEVSLELYEKIKEDKRLKNFL